MAMKYEILDTEGRCDDMTDDPEGYAWTYADEDGERGGDAFGTPEAGRIWTQETPLGWFDYTHVFRTHDGRVLGYAVEAEEEQR